MKVFFFIVCYFQSLPKLHRLFDEYVFNKVNVTYEKN